MNNDVCEEYRTHDEGIVKASERMPHETMLDDMAELFKVFGDSTRIRILYALFEEELCVCDLTKLLRISQPAVSYQLKILRRAGLIRNRREGKTMYYRLADDHVKTIIGMAKEHLEE